MSFLFERMRTQDELIEMFDEHFKSNKIRVRGWGGEYTGRLKTEKEADWVFHVYYDNEDNHLGCVHYDGDMIKIIDLKDEESYYWNGK